MTCTTATNLDDVGQYWVDFLNQAYANQGSHVIKLHWITTSYHSYDGNIKTPGKGMWLGYFKLVMTGYLDDKEKCFPHGIAYSPSVSDPYASRLEWDVNNYAYKSMLQGSFSIQAKEYNQNFDIDKMRINHLLLNPGVKFDLGKHEFLYKVGEVEHV